MKPNSESIADELHKGQEKATDVVKTWIFDLLAIGVVIAAFLLSLGALDILKVSWETFAQLFVDFVPYYLAAIILSDNYYMKGVFKAKSTHKYINAMESYSKTAGSLNGHQMQVLPEFCEEFNQKALVKIQSGILRKVAIDFDIFDKPYVKAGITCQPLKVLTKKELLKLYNKDVVKVIQRAKNVNVKGINENLLLSSIKSYDDTDIGRNENELAKQNNVKNVIKLFVCMFLLSFITFKDVNSWGWAGAVFVLFKMMWIFTKSYTQYFKGYNNITINLVNHIVRKDDIIKQFNYWYDDKYKITVVKNVTVPEVKTEQIDGLGKVALFSTNTQENSDIKANS